MPVVRARQLQPGDWILERDCRNKAHKTPILGVLSDGIGCRGIHVQTKAGPIWCYDRETLVEIA